MTDETSESEYDASYIAGLLDGIGRVRFDISKTNDGTYSVRPMLRIKPHGTEMRAAVVGEFLEERGYQYDYVERDYGDEFFRLQQRRDLENLEEYLRAESAHLVRELEFTNGVFADEFDFNLLEPREAYRFLLTRDELRYGWRPRGRHHVSPDDILEGHEISSEQVRPMPLPVGNFRSDYTIEWVTGLYDGLCRYRPTIAQSGEYKLGYTMYPIARVHGSGVHSRLIDHFLRFCEDYDLSYGNSSGSNDLNIVFTGASNIRRTLDILFPRLLVLAEHSDAMVNGILPRFDNGEDDDKQGFYQILRDFDPIAQATGGPFRHREYDPDYFADIWQDNLDLAEGDSLSGKNEEKSRFELLMDDGEETISPVSFRESLGRYHTVLDVESRDSDAARDLKSLYGDRCQICGARLASGDGTGYSEVHHIKPSAHPHNGPAIQDNMVVLCPNHHADFDNGVVRIDIASLSIEHPFDSSVNGNSISIKGDHAISDEFLRYHNENLCRLKEGGG